MKPITRHGLAVKKTLRNYVKNQQANASGTLAGDFFDRLLSYAASGKLLRGCLVCFSYEGFSHKPPDETILNAAAAIELTHSALLIHDDIMDNDDLRRGRPSFHKQYETLAEKKRLKNAGRFGTNMALAAGDAVLFQALGMLPNDGGTATVVRARQLFFEQLLKTCFGQMQDIASEARPDTPSKQQLYQLMRDKTASYTISLPLMLGAALAGEPEPTIKTLRTIGDAAGTIFQIRDDELGIIGNQKQTGKPVGADIREGKKTLIYYYLQQQSSPYEKQWLKERSGNSDITEKEINHVRQLIKKHHIGELIDKDVIEFEKKATVAIHKLKASQKTRTELHRLVTFCANRQF